MSPRVALGAVVAAAFSVYVALGMTMEAPRAFSDELLYMEVAASIAAGDGLEIRGEPYRYAPLYPLVLAPLVALAPDRETAYALAKLLNALLFALTAVPVYALSRRVLEPWPSVVAAALAVSVPSALYVGVVMTESLAYLVFAIALLALALVLERPTLPRQLGALAGCGVAAATRTQFLALFAALVVGVALAALLRRDRSLGRDLASLWPTALAIAGGVIVFLLAPLRRGDAPDPLGNYEPLWRSYEAQEIARWLVYHFANLDLYLAVVPVAVTPVVLALWFSRARQGAEREAGLLALFASVNATMLLLAAAFNTTIFAGNRLHDRPVFYVLPLWIVVVVAWVRAGAPRPVVATAIGAGSALLLPLALPFRSYALEDVYLQFNAMPTALWTVADDALGALGVSGLLAMVCFALALVLAAVLLPARALSAFPAVLLAWFVLMAAVSWHGAHEEARRFLSALPEDEHGWITRRIENGRAATLVTALTPCTARSTADAFYLSEFFDGAVERVAHLGTSPDYLPSPRAKIGRGGHVLVGDAELTADLAVAQAGVELAARRVGPPTSAGLALWETDGPVVLRDPRVIRGRPSERCEP